MAPVLNLNNEVVKMRKDVKKVKVLIIRKLTRNIAKLKSKKGTEELVHKNQRRAQRLLEEIHAIKELKPDDVTKTALQKEINFEKVCKKPDSTAESRAIARLATHTLLKKKIASIKEAVEDFKEARRNHIEVDDNPKQSSNVTEPAKSVEKTEQPVQSATETKQTTKQPEHKQSILRNGDNQSKQGKVKVLPNRKVVENKKEKEDLIEDDSNRLLKGPNATAENLCDEREKPCIQPNLQVQTAEHNTEVKVELVESVPEKKAPVVQEVNSDSSDIENSDKEEKEYFDDSTEERFYKQSSGFEDSDSDSEDDFFLGKVKRTKKKKGNKNCPGVKEKKECSSVPTKSAAADKEMQKRISTDKAVKLKSLFCNTLSEPNQKSSNKKRDTKLPTVRNAKTVIPQQLLLAKKPLPIKRPGGVKQQNSRQDGPLHPSWEASRKRKEQQSQITAFQGKKIRFED